MAVRCRNCGAPIDLPEFHGATLVTCRECSWQEVLPPRRRLPEDPEHLAGAAYERRRRRQERLRALFARIRQLPPRDFVLFCGDALAHRGATVDVIGTEAASHDLELRHGDRRVYVACRPFADHRPVVPDDLEELAGAMRRDGADAGLFVTTGRFAPECGPRAALLHLELMDGAALRHEMESMDAERLAAWTKTVEPDGAVTEAPPAGSPPPP